MGKTAYKTSTKPAQSIFHLLKNAHEAALLLTFQGFVKLISIMITAYILQLILSQFRAQKYCDWVLTSF